MTIDDYAEWAASVAKVTADSDNAKLSYLGLGLAAESGEAADTVKKLLRDGKLDRAALIEELGDVIYYWTCLCIAAGEAPSELLAKSRDKIAGRVSQ
jgi:NTP pyrophosphatase (non-canonical NTP hydrolase)